MLSRILILVALTAAYISVIDVTLASPPEHDQSDHRARQPVDATTPSKSIRFDEDVLPILAGRCLICHGADRSEGGLRFTDRVHALSRLDSGTHAIVPGVPGDSQILSRVTSNDAELKMPPDGDRLTDSQVEVLRRWIIEGAAWEPHWAFRPVVRPEPPAVHHANWPQNPIDQFVLKKLESEGIEPSAEASRPVLIKRLYFDLLGLLPDFEEVEFFSKDPNPQAYENLVDRLLASPYFGERWGRHWLDKARYADSDGYEVDAARPDAWRYRDWVINAINEDLGFDRFTIEQLAGDLLSDATPRTRLATAFNRQTLTNSEGGVDREQFRIEAIFDRVETIGSAWLGLTLGCARCHSHKYDQISQQEYYQLFAFFNNADETETELPFSEAEQLLGKNSQKPDDVKIRVLSERTDGQRKTYCFYRGDFLQPESEVQPGTPGILPPLVRQNNHSPADRLDLAKWLVSIENPLTPRVAVNDMWGHLFGQGLVPTQGDFGVRAERPSHLELLDWLAAEFTASGYSRKAMIKVIVMSATYRQSSKHRPELSERDPYNRWLSRQNRLRVEGELIRDVSLSAGGLLSPKIGGPSVFPPMPAETAALSYAGNFKWTTSQGEDRYRRGMYTFFKRTAPDPNLTTFDCPDGNVSCVRRERSTTPLQALAMLNNEVFVESAHGLARRVLSSGISSDSERLKAAVQWSLARSPTTDELQELANLLNIHRAYYATHEPDMRAMAGNNAVAQVSTVEYAAWMATARVLLNLDEFITKD